MQPGGVFEHPPDKARRADQRDREQRMHHQQPPGHVPDKQGIQHDADRAGGAGNQRKAHDLAAAGIAPENIVHAADGEGDKIDAEKMEGVREGGVIVGGLAGFPVKAQKVGKI